MVTPQMQFGSLLCLTMCFYDSVMRKHQKMSGAPPLTFFTSVKILLFIVLQPKRRGRGLEPVTMETAELRILAV